MTVKQQTNAIRVRGKMREIVIDEEETKTLHYGWGKFQPAFLQRVHNARFLVGALALCAIVQTMLINALIPIILTTLEHRYMLSSVQLGIFASAYDFAILLCLIPVTHFGERGHKGRWLAGGMVIMAIGSFICVLPQVIAPAYDPHLTEEITDSGHIVDNGICHDEISNITSSSFTMAEPEYVNNYLYFALLLIGNCLHGAGSTPIYTLGITYLDENVREHDSAYYLGIFLGCSMIGPILGYIGGGIFLRIYGDFLTADMSKFSSLSPAHPQWYGAWWLGFVLAGIIALVAAVVISGFAHRLPNAPATNEVLEKSTKLKFKSGREELWFGVKTVYTSTTYLFLCKVEILESALATGVVNFFPKLLESYFRLPSSIASIVTGTTLVPAAVLGNVIGGVIIRRFKIGYPRMLLQSVICNVITLFLGGVFLLHCPQGTIVGVNTDYITTKHYDHSPYTFTDLGSSVLYNSTHTCNAGCHCSPTLFDPVCDAHNNVTYITPCHAGCHTRLPNGTSFAECSCVEDAPDSLQEGFCSTDCYYLVPFIAIFACYVTIGFVGFIPIQESELRSVPFSQRSLAFGIRWIFIRILGTIPGPILLGRFIDGACLLWRRGDDDAKDCPIYDNSRLSTLILLVGLPLKIMTIICLSIAWHYGKPYTSVAPELRDALTMAGKLDKAHKEERRAARAARKGSRVAPETEENLDQDRAAIVQEHNARLYQEMRADREASNAEEKSDEQMEMDQTPPRHHASPPPPTTSVPKLPPI